MPETIEKLRPDRDLQCYFERPSAIAALSETTPAGFVVSGSWRQAFDWAVIEWNRDNVFEHPAFRNLPDGNLSGLILSYEETRTNCIPLDSNLFATVEWPTLRIWAASGGVEQLYNVSLKNHSTPVAGSYSCATADFELQGSLTAGDYIGLAWLNEQYNHEITASDTAASALQSLTDAINALSPTVVAARTAARITLTYLGAGATLATSTEGHNGNRVGVYGFVSGARTEIWSPQNQTFRGGISPSRWRTTLDFSDLHDISDILVPTTAVRKMRWTFAADQQQGHFERSEFEVTVSAWEVTGTNRSYRVAGPGSRRIEDNADDLVFTGSWQQARGNFSGGTIRSCTAPAAGVTSAIVTQSNHSLYLGCRYTFNGAAVSVSIDSGPPSIYNLAIPGEDVLARIYLGELTAGQHSVTVSHAGIDGEVFYFDFLELAHPTTQLPVPLSNPTVTLATDWDTDHSIALPSERSAWFIHSLGFHGRVNHYTGALWFYELIRQGHQYASATITFTGTPVFSESTDISINRVGLPAASATVFHHVNLIGETAANIATALELAINNGSTGIWAEADAGMLTIYSRSMGLDGNLYTISASPGSGVFTAVTNGSTFAGGINGDWRTDLTAVPRLNRAARDWSRSFFAALKVYGMEMTAAFSMELQHGDPSEAAGIAQRYPSGNPVLLNTPALQTNFSPISLGFWEQVYLDMADVMAEAGVPPYLQFGEVQWWYFPYDASGLPFHDAYAKQQFLAQYGFDIRAVADGFANPASYPQEASFLPALIGAFTTDVMSFVRAQHPDCLFEVLYPPDVNEGSFNRVINYAPSWTAANLTCLKTESFTYTGNRDFDKSRSSIAFSDDRGFPNGQRSHLIGIGDPTTPWLKEVDHATGHKLESVVLFALDQFCLIGYSLPMRRPRRRSIRLAS
ncbi:MAG TPA: hypothetical protein VM120_28425 [Bryobacteraceae bacterium]|nr:hypothetical protein [Bryobacteraceae bacterium]